MQATYFVKLLNTVFVKPTRSDERLCKSVVELEGDSVGGLEGWSIEEESATALYLLFFILSSQSKVFNFRLSPGSFYFLPGS